MLRFSQYPSEERVFMVNRKTRGDSFKAIRYDYKKFFPLTGREPNKMTIDRNAVHDSAKCILFKAL